MLVLAIDQAEDLFPDSTSESAALLNLLRELLADDAPAVLVIVTIRSEAYEKLQTAKALEGIGQQFLSLTNMPRGAYQAVIEGPAARLKETDRPLLIEPALTQALLSDIEDGGGRDALPLLAFTLERLYLEYGGRGRLTIADYDALGRIKGSIEAAVERAFQAADGDARIPRDRDARLALLRRGLIPWLAGIDPDSGSPRRQKARISEIPEEALPLINLLVEQRLLSTDRNRSTGERTIEPAHEALLRQWGSLQGWLQEDFAALTNLETVKRAARDWAANARGEEWLSHRARRLADAKRLLQRQDLAGKLDTTDRAYIETSSSHERAMRNGVRRSRIVLGAISGVAVGGLIYAGISQKHVLMAYSHELIDRIWPKVLTAAQEQTLKQLGEFQECTDCPVMVVIPAGMFKMGAPGSDASQVDPDKYAENLKEHPDAYADELPIHNVTIAKPFAVGKYDITFDEWDTCYMLGGCATYASDENWGRGARPVVHVDWNDAQQYVAWLSIKTGKTYRLLSESEWEYSARAGSVTAFNWGDRIGTGYANCDGCGSNWDNKETVEVGKFKPNAFNLFDMAGNVWQWVEDCYMRNYEAAPANGSAVVTADCRQHVLRGGSWYSWPINSRSAMRAIGPQPLQPLANTPGRTVGFRVARTLSATDQSLAGAGLQ